MKTQDFDIRSNELGDLKDDCKKRQKKPKKQN